MLGYRRSRKGRVMRVLPTSLILTPFAAPKMKDWRIHKAWYTFPNGGWQLDVRWRGWCFQIESLVA